MPAKSFPVNSLMQRYTLIRGVQRERWYLNIKPFATIAFHLVTPTHHPRRRVKKRTAAVRMTFARLEKWLLPNHARSLDLGQFAARIRDHPVPAQQMHRLVPLILDKHSISPKILRAVRR